MKPNLLIISYFFPPNNKVGGRRWAKFGKYLSQKDYNISVLCVDLPFTGNCPWEKDINSYKNKVYRIPYIEHRPYYRVNKAPANISGKLKYRVSLYKEKYFPEKSHGDTLDVSRKYGKDLIAKATQIIEQNNINTVIISGGPFHWCYEAISLKNKFTNLNFLLDLRDFWTGGETYRLLDQVDKKEEDRKELICIANSNHIFSPAERIIRFLKDKYPSYTNKITELPHAYDIDEIPNLTESRIFEENEISFAYGGILYPKMEKGINRSIELLQNIKTKGFKVKLDIYTFDRSYEDLFKNAGLSDNVQYHESIAPNELFKKFVNTDYLLQLRAGESQEQHFKSTKFYELIALRRPIIYFGPKGDVGDFIDSNKLGFDSNNDLEIITNSIIENKKHKLIPDPQFDISKFEFGTVTNVLEKFL